MRLYKLSTLATASIATVILLTSSAQADENAEITELLSRLDALERRLSALEAVRSFAGFMPDLADAIPTGC